MKNSGKIYPQSFVDKLHLRGFEAEGVAFDEEYYYDGCLFTLIDEGHGLAGLGKAADFLKQNRDVVGIQVAEVKPDEDDLPTIEEIKKATEPTQPYYFNSDTMDFFDQSMDDFRILRSPAGRIFIYAPCRNETARVAWGYSFREFTGDNLLTPSVPLPRTLPEVLRHIRDH